MNAAARKMEFMTFVDSKVELIGDETLVLTSPLLNGPSRPMHSDLRLSPGATPFDPRSELKRLLQTPPLYSRQELEPAADAARRMLDNPLSDADWVGELAKDLSRFDD